jgi:hypothetical protein
MQHPAVRAANSLLAVNWNEVCTCSNDLLSANHFSEEARRIMKVPSRKERPYSLEIITNFEPQKGGESSEEQ